MLNDVTSRCLTLILSLVLAGWDYRVAKSDLGVGHRRQRSRSPPERETFSEVGSHGHMLHTKQVSLWMGMGGCGWVWVGVAIWSLYPMPDVDSTRDIPI